MLPAPKHGPPGKSSNSGGLEIRLRSQGSTAATFVASTGPSAPPGAGSGPELAAAPLVLGFASLLPALPSWEISIKFTLLCAPVVFCLLKGDSGLNY